MDKSDDLKVLVSVQPNSTWESLDTGSWQDETQKILLLHFFKCEKKRIKKVYLQNVKRYDQPTI